MKLRILLATLLCCGLFSGCMPLQTNVEDLMQPPKLTELQYQVDTALREAVGKDFLLKYPRNGSYKSAFNFMDLDSDGNDEAVAFFSDQEDSIQIAICTHTDNQWRVTDIVKGLSTCNEVDFVSLETIGSRQRLLVGWGGTGLENNIMDIYGYSPDDSGQQSLHFDSRWDYNRMAVTDMDSNGQNEMLLLVAVNSYEQTSPFAQLVGENSDGVVDLLSEVELPRNIASFFPSIMGKLSSGVPGATVDCILNNGKFCTLTLAYEDGQLVTPLNTKEDLSLFRSTIRGQSVLSCDINEDGIVDIPIERPAAGYDAAAGDAVWFTDYCNILEKQMVSVQTAYVSPAQGYRFRFPTLWQGQPVSAFIQPDGSEIIFFLNQNGDLYDHSMELMRLKVYSTLDGQDKLDDSRYFQLATKGTYVYCMALPAEQVEGLSLPKKQMTELFSLVTS